jgi:prepilin-type N-terminal cleavage/methylation domain-containing protein
MKVMKERRRQSGFTLAEILVVIVLGSVVAASLYQVLVYQQRLYTRERAATYRQDALRLANAVLTGDLMEASASEGDFVAVEPDSLSLRSPVGFALVCSVDSSSGRLGVFDIEGRVLDSEGDSLLIYHPDGWLVAEASDVDSEGIGGLECPYAAGPFTEKAIHVDGSLIGVPVGAPVRAFHRYTYVLEEEEEGSWWLARDDASGTEILAGPFVGDGSGLVFAYFNAAGAPTTDPALVARLDVMLVAESEPYEQLDTLTASVRPRNQ